MEEEIEYTIRVYRYYFRIYRDRRFSIIVFNFVNKKFNEGKERERERDMRERYEREREYDDKIIVRAM